MQREIGAWLRASVVDSELCGECDMVLGEFEGEEESLMVGARSERCLVGDAKRYRSALAKSKVAQSSEGGGDGQVSMRRAGGTSTALH